MIALGVAAALLVLVAAWAVLTYNGLRRLQFACDDAWSLVDTQLQRRTDLVPNLVAAVEGYAVHERTLLAALTAARDVAAPLHDPSPAHAAAEHRLGSSMAQALALGEAYPELAASNHFTGLQRTLSDLETQIAASREIYNGNVAAYRTQISQIPSSLIARWFGFGDRSMFELGYGGLG